MPFVDLSGFHPQPRNGYSSLYINLYLVFIRLSRCARRASCSNILVSILSFLPSQLEDGYQVCLSLFCSLPFTPRTEFSLDRSCFFYRIVKKRHCHCCVSKSAANEWFIKSWNRPRIPLAFHDERPAFNLYMCACLVGTSEELYGRFAYLTIMLGSYWRQPDVARVFFFAHLTMYLYSIPYAITESDATHWISIISALHGLPWRRLSHRQVQCLNSVLLAVPPFRSRRCCSSSV